MGKRKLVALLFLAVPWVCLRFVIVVFPDHTHLLFLVKCHLSRGLMFAKTPVYTVKPEKHLTLSATRVDYTLCISSFQRVKH